MRFNLYVLQSLKINPEEFTPMKTFIYPEMMVHVALCTHKLPTFVLLASDNRELLLGELSRYRESAVTSVSSANLLESFRNAEDKSVDVLLVDSITDDSAVIAHINRILKEDGLVVMQHPSLDEVGANTSLMQILGNYFKIINYFTFFLNLEERNLIKISKMKKILASVCRGIELYKNQAANTLQY